MLYKSTATHQLLTEAHRIPHFLRSDSTRLPRSTLLRILPATLFLTIHIVMLSLRLALPSNIAEKTTSTVAVKDSAAEGREGVALQAAGGGGVRMLQLWQQRRKSGITAATSFSTSS